MQPDPTSPIPAWEYLYTQDASAIVGVTPMAVKRVFLKLFDGTETHVDIPVADYSAGAVERAANKLAQQQLEIRQIQPPTIPMG